MSRIITYGLDNDTGQVVSRVGSALAWPVLDYERIGTGGDFSQPMTYTLERVALTSLPRGTYPRVWTKKVPVEVKNLHRAFWGFPALRA